MLLKAYLLSDLPLLCALEKASKLAAQPRVPLSHHPSQAAESDLIFGKVLSKNSGMQFTLCRLISRVITGHPRKWQKDSAWLESAVAGCSQTMEWCDSSRECFDVPVSVLSAFCASCFMLIAQWESPFFCVSNRWRLRPPPPSLSIRWTRGYAVDISHQFELLTISPMKNTARRRHHLEGSHGVPAASEFFL